MTDSVVSDPSSGGYQNHGNGEKQGGVTDAGSVVSESTQTTQTRFCFYNAEDFISKSPKQRRQASETAKNNRYSFYSTETSTESGSLPGKSQSMIKSPRASTAPPSMPESVEDPNEILKSLQEHEQQRRDILKAPGAVKPRPSNHSNHPVMERTSMHSNVSESSNPYEDAIKDALELLRRHRTGNSKGRPTVDTTEEGLRGNDEKEMTLYTENEVRALSRSLEEVNVSIEEAVAATSSGHNTDTANLGEAYQVEIEARRKQRQERMARYANRLAELKQEGTTPNPKIKTLTPKCDTTSGKWEEKSNGNAPSTTRSAPMLIAAGKTDGLEPETASASPDEVQRGVERVLLAILERANSRGRSVQASSFEGGHEIEELEIEEKKSPSAEQVESDEDLLVRAMSDLLGAPSTSSLGSSSPNRNAIQQWMEAAEQEVDEVISDEESNVTGPFQAATKHEPSESEVTERDGMAQDELDEMVLQVLNKEKSASEDSQEDSFDRRVRSILSQEKATKDEDDSHAEQIDDKDESTSHQDVSDDVDNDEEEYHMSNEEDETIRSNAFTDEDTSDGEAFTGEEYTDEDDDEDEEAFTENVDVHNAELDGVLGPLSKAAGGTTGVVLEDGPRKDRVASPSILESLSAAMSIVTGRDNKSQELDKYAADHDEDSVVEAGMESEDDEARDLMRSLCAHLLPVGVNQSSKLLDKRPAWDESNPDEAGYRIIRLTLPQLTSVERAFDRMVTGLKKKSEKKLSVAGTDEAFERDLQTAEELLDQSEKQIPSRTDSSANIFKTVKEESEQFEFAKEVGEGENLVDFPGVKPTGRGEMGDLEYFQLPIIFKSHVTGFEPTKDMYLEPGNVVAGQYLVEGELGSAAFSTAYRCVDLNSGEGPDDQEEVCLKVIKNTKDFFDQSLDEIKILELLRQTGKCHEKRIVEMRTFFYHREHLIIVTELLRQNLFEFGKFIIDNDEEPYFTVPRLAYVTRQVLVALEFVHRLGLVHSDVKPENILLSSYSRAQVKLIDFGSSCYLTDRQSSYIQSRSYRAPEVVLGLPYDGRIDIWSLGCVVAEMFTGEVTFQNDSIVSMLSRIEAICGPFPRHMIAQGRQSGRFFAKSGLLFEKVADEKDESGHDSDESDDDDSNEARRQYVDIFQPKTTSISARLGFDADLMDRFDADIMLTKEESRQALFVDFVRKLLTIDSDARPTARQALQHPWMMYAETLTEEDIKYPSS